MKRIESFDLRKGIEVYSTIAFGRNTSTSEVDWLHHKLLDYMRKYRSEEKGMSWDKPLSKAYKILRSAKTRQEKVLAIDATLGYLHEAGSILTLGFWKGISKRDSGIADHILDRLAEED